MNNQTGIKRNEEFKKRVSNSLKGHLVSEETRRKIGLANKGRKLSEEHKKSVSLAQRGKKQSIETIAKRVKKLIGRKWTDEMRKKFSEKKKGNNNNLWKGGITPENKRIRESINFRLWREAVFARDNWICQVCGKRGCELHPHHIKSFAYYPEFRFAIDNGITLCKDCHKKTDNYGNNQQQPAMPVSGGLVGAGQLIMDGR